MIHAASRLALATLRERLESVLGSLPADGGTAKSALAAELYSVADLLTRQPRLRRTLGDPSTDPSARSQLAGGLLRGKVGEATLGLVVTAAEQRWSAPWDLTDALEIAGDESLLASAEQQGVLDDVEDELFRLERILESSGDLVTALDEVAAPAERRVELVSSLLAGKAQRITVELVSHAVASERKRSILLALDELLAASAARRDRSVARVISATELTDVQSNRLALALSSLYGRPISIRSAVDPSIQGGLQVRVGDEVIDGTVAARLAAARNALSA